MAVTHTRRRARKSAAAALLLHQAVSETAPQAAMDAFCETVGAAIPGDVGDCAGVHSAQEDGGELWCVGDYHLGDSDVRCNMNSQLAVVRQTMNVMSTEDSQDLEAVLNAYCRTACGDTYYAFLSSLPGNGANWLCVGSGGAPGCGSNVETAVWAYQHATRNAILLGIQHFVPRCTPPAVRLFNLGDCTADCPEYWGRPINMNDGTEACLPLIVHQASRLVNSTLQATEKGAGNVTLVIALPLLPGTYAEDVNTTYVVDMKETAAELERLAPNPCDAKWKRQSWERPTRLEVTPDAVSDAQCDSASSFREQVQELCFNAAQLEQDFGQLSPNATARVLVNVIFLDAMTDANKADSISLAVNRQPREPYWPRMGLNHDGVVINREHVCQNGVASDVPEPHCKATLIVDAESTDNGNFELVITGTKSAQGPCFRWAVANTKVEMPFIETTLRYPDLNGACRLGRAVPVGDHLERSGQLSVSLVGNWTDAQGPMGDTWNTVRWPVTLRFPKFVQGEFSPYSAWDTTVYSRELLDGGSFPSYLAMFEESEDGTPDFSRPKRAPRYELGDMAHVSHCTEDSDLGLTVRFTQLRLSKTVPPDPTKLDGWDLTESVDVHSVGRCVNYSFPVVNPCEYCSLHAFAEVSDEQGSTRRLSHHVIGINDDRLLDEESGRRLHAHPGRRLDQVQPPVTSQSSPESGIAVASVPGFIVDGGTATELPTTAPEVTTTTPSETDVTDSANHLAAASMWSAGICATISLGMIV